MAPYKGRALVDHAAQAVRQARVDELVAVVASNHVRNRLEGFRCVGLADKDAPQSESLRAGITQAQRLGAERAVVVLADMPLVTAPLINDVLDLADTGRTSAASDGTYRSPPACFPSQAFDALLASTGDTGASAMLRALPAAQLVTVSPSILRDVDVPEDLRDLPD